jgi:CRISPR-associated protein Csx14
MKETGHKEVFIFVAGSTPQIITETIYALSQKTPPVYTDEIYIVTTSKGEKLIKDTLTGREILKGLAKEYNLPELELNDNSFIVAKDSAGNAIDDIRTAADNEAMGDAITALIKEKTKDHASRLHCSLAGGRKTMSFYMGAALQLFGRPWDKLYHVLVSPEFESNPHFFYKPLKDTVIECRMPDGAKKQLSTKNAEVYLAELPFVRLSGKLSLHKKSFRELVEEGQQEIDIATVQPELLVNLSERIVYIGGNVVEMIPVHLMIYTAFLRMKTEHCRYPGRQYCLECTDCFSTLNDLSSRPALEEMAKDYGKIYRSQPMRVTDLLSKWKEGMETPAIRQNISKTNKSLEDQTHDKTLLPFYTISTVKKYANSRYGVRVEKRKIRIE